MIKIVLPEVFNIFLSLNQFILQSIGLTIQINLYVTYNVHMILKKNSIEVKKVFILTRYS